MDVNKQDMVMEQMVQCDGDSKYRYLKELGYSDSDIRSYSTAWNTGIMDYLQENKARVVENMRYLQTDFDKELLLKLPVFYPEAFVLSPDVFVQHFEILKKRFPDDYAEIIQKQFWSYDGYDARYVKESVPVLYEPFLGMLHKDEETIKTAVESLGNLASRQYKFINMLRKDIGLDISTDDIPEDALLDLECGKWELMANAKALTEQGLNKELLSELLWHCPHILTYSTPELEDILSSRFGDTYIEVLNEKYEDDDEKLGDDLCELF